MSKQDKPEAGSQPLSEVKREAFCHLFVNNPFQPRVMYRQAGYKPKTDEACRVATSRLLHDVTVMDRVAYLRKELNHRLGRSADDVVSGIYEIRDRCLSENKLVRDKRGKPIEVEIVVDSKDGLTQVVKRCVIWQFDKVAGLKASELLSKYYGILTDNVSVNDGDAIKQRIDDEAEDVVANLMLNKEHGVNKDSKIEQHDTNTEFPVIREAKIEPEHPIPSIAKPIDDKSEANA